MEKRHFWILFVLLGFVILIFGDHLMAQTPAKGKYDALKRKYVKGEYPEPRFPAYLKPAKNVDEVLPFARAAVRQIGGRTPMGLVNPGQTVLIVTVIEDDEMLIQGIKKAFEERGVKVQVLPEYEAIGVSKEKALEFDRVLNMATYNHDGLMEADVWFSKWGNKEVPMEWLKERRPELYDEVYKKYPLSPEILELKKKFEAYQVGKGIIKYLDNHPEVNCIFWGGGGRTRHRKILEKYSDKYYGSWIFGSRGNLLSRVPSFPGDVWRLVEERTVESLSWVDRVQAFDPEGTDVTWEVTPEEAESWARGVYQQGHLYMNPRAASGRFPYSVVEYPAFTGKWIPPILARPTGKIAGCSNHAGVFPRVEAITKEGYLQEIKGEGPYPEIWRELYKNYPKIHEAQYPWIPKPGYFWFWETSFGTNPKFFLFRGDPTGERNHSGVVHWAFGVKVEHAPEAPVLPKKWFEFAAENKLPADHWMHIHTVLLTYQVKIRDTSKWLTLINKGRLTALDDPMARALASRYGDPDDILADDWRPHLPGINAPGNYAEYARDPQKFLIKEVFEKIENGTYPYFYTPSSMRKKK